MVIGFIVIITLYLWAELGVGIFFQDSWGEINFYIYNMRILKWILFSLFMLATIFCFFIVYEFYTNLSFIDYPYVIGGFVSFFLALITFKFKVK